MINKIVLLFLLFLLSGCNVATKTENVATRCYEQCQYIPEIETIEVIKIERNYEAEKIDNYLASKGSPMTGLGELCVSLEQQTGVPCSWLIAISGVESGFGKYGYVNGTYNPFGYGVHLGYSFDNFTNAIIFFANSFKKNYIDKGFDTIEKIGYVYCPSNSKWSSEVNYFISEINEY